MNKKEVLHDLKKIGRAMRVLAKACDKLYEDVKDILDDAR